MSPCEVTHNLKNLTNLYITRINVCYRRLGLEKALIILIRQKLRKRCDKAILAWVWDKNQVVLASDFPMVVKPRCLNSENVIWISPVAL